MTTPQAASGPKHPRARLAAELIGETAVVFGLGGWHVWLGITIFGVFALLLAYNLGNDKTS